MNWIALVIAIIFVIVLAAGLMSVRWSSKHTKKWHKDFEDQGLPRNK